MTKRRSDTASAAVRALIDAASSPMQPPKHSQLRPGDLPFFRGVIASRSPDEWSEADLVVAVQLARVQADIETESKALDLEGSVIGDRINPRATVIDQLSKRQMAMMRTLRMGGRVAGDARHEEGRRKLARRAKEIRDDLADDELLA